MSYLLLLNRAGLIHPAQEGYVIYLYFIIPALAYNSLISVEFFEI